MDMQAFVYCPQWRKLADHKCFFGCGACKQRDLQVPSCSVAAMCEVDAHHRPRPLHNGKTGCITQSAQNDQQTSRFGQYAIKTCEMISFMRLNIVDTSNPEALVEDQQSTSNCNRATTPNT
eukprot:4390696-Amphidinium_carterae.1